MKIRLSGLSDGSYALCRKQFDLASTLLRNPEENREELSGILRILNNNPQGARILQAERKERYSQLYDRLVEATSLKSVIGPLTITESPLDGGNKRIPKDWYNYQEQTGTVIAPMGVIYNSFKVLKQQYEQGSAQERAQAGRLLASLRDDFDWPKNNSWLISGTQLDHEPEGLDARIVQHYGCNKPNLVKETKFEIPVYRGIQTLEVLNEKLGLNYHQVLFDTGDDSETIMQVLEFISGKPRDKIETWTATKSSRKSHPKRAAGFYYNYIWFLVNSYDIIDDNPGRVRGVDLSAVGAR